MCSFYRNYYCQLVIFPLLLSLSYCVYRPLYDLFPCLVVPQLHRGRREQAKGLQGVAAALGQYLLGQGGGRDSSAGLDSWPADFAAVEPARVNKVRFLSHNWSHNWSHKCRHNLCRDWSSLLCKSGLTLTQS